jgi:hypothetical protein
MRANDDAVASRERNGLAHRRFVPSMSAARDIGGADERHEQRVGSRAFAKVAVEVD